MEDSEDSISSFKLVFFSMEVLFLWKDCPGPPGLDVTTCVSFSPGDAVLPTAAIAPCLHQDVYKSS